MDSLRGEAGGTLDSIPLDQKRISTASKYLAIGFTPFRPLCFHPNRAMNGW